MYEQPPNNIKINVKFEPHFFTLAKQATQEFNVTFK